jgi:ABC-2 type transport system ATP-binding protein
MEYPIQTENLTKRFDKVLALDGVSLAIRPQSIVGLLGRNGCGKTTLLDHVVGLYLPTEGAVRTLGVDSAALGHDQLSSIGFVPQEIRLLDWMTVEQQLRYVSSFYPQWDSGRQARLLQDLDLDLDKRVGALSTGNLQKLAIILAVCHHPELLILDEPVSDLDPIVRARLLEFLLEVLREDQATIVVSSHILRDVEKIVDWVVCLDDGRVIADAALDDLKEQYSEWRVSSVGGELPQSFSEPFVLEQQVRGREGLLRVRADRANLSAFCVTHGVTVETHPLNLEQIFPLLLERTEQ